MTTLVIGLLFGSMFGFGGGLTVSAALKRKAKPQPVNMLKGFVLPHPSDDRWEVGTGERVTCQHRVYRLGCIEVCSVRGRVTIDGVDVVDPDEATTHAELAYAKAVAHEQLERKALSAILGEDL